MKKVAILPRKYYNTPKQNYVAGQELIVKDEEADEMEADGIVQIIEDVEDVEDTEEEKETEE